MRKLYVFLTLILALMMAAIPTIAQDDDEAGTIVDIVSAAAAGDGQDAEFTVLAAALEAADSIFFDLLSDPEQSLTVFAPTDAAFAELIEALGTTTENLLADVLLINDLLSYHVVPGALPEASIREMDGGILGTVLRGESLNILLAEGDIFINASRITTSDLIAVNGIVHVVDTVLAPAPETNLTATGTLADVVIANVEDATPEFTTLLAAVEAADPAILAALTGRLPYTVLAPTDDAFERALTELGLTAEELLEDTDTLNAILSYHIIPGAFTSDDLWITYLSNIGTPRLSTLLPGITLDLLLQDNSIVLNYAAVILPDIPATNGVIHVIDAVLIPPL